MATEEKADRAPTEYVVLEEIAEDTFKKIGTYEGARPTIAVQAMLVEFPGNKEQAHLAVPARSFWYVAKADPPPPPPLRLAATRPEIDQPALPGFEPPEE